MKKTILYILIITGLFQSAHTRATAPDSAYVFAYSTLKNGGHNGLHFAWSPDRKNWYAIGPEFCFLFCDYGRWGSEKRLVTPYLFLDKDNLWHCVWSINEKDGAFAHSTSKDLVYWYPQTYPVVSKENNCQQPELSFDKSDGVYNITWISDKNGRKEIYGTSTSDFKTYTPARLSTETARTNQRERIVIAGNSETGTVHKIAWKVVEKLINTKKLDDFRKIQNNESFQDDSIRFKNLKPLDATLTINAVNSKKISNLLTGIFFEDINYAADGGLYAELIQNRDFEYSPGDKEGRDKSWNSNKAWNLKGNQATFTIDSVSPVHPNNKHYAMLSVQQVGAIFSNEGFDGIPLKEGEKYDFSMFTCIRGAKTVKLAIRLVDKSGEVIGQTQINSASTIWKKQSAVITAFKSVSDARLEIIPQNTGTVALDMISLFPQKTFKNRKNGLRADLAQTIADIHPRFMRFPGGCVSHGDGLGNIYRWKNTIGSLEGRKPQRNLWGYHQTAGLGYYEYFQFCEDIGAEPLPVIAAGVSCQNSATGGAGQQGGIPICEMQQYVQDVLDLIEWANGDTKTKWGKLRAEAGHPKPFNLKYVGVGNEDLINDIFEERFTMIFKAVKEKHPEITVIGTVGPTFEGTDYTEGWKIADKLHVPMVDEHYYQSTGWFINNNDYYDKYDRTKSKVYLGEYASWGNALYNALAEAHYLTAVERNGDVVSMASYAPMLAKEGHTQWNPDLIYFNNTEVKPTVNYYVQQLYGQNSGDNYLSNSLKFSGNKEDVNKRVASSVILDSKTGDVIVKLVNMLPVLVNVNLKLDGIANIQSQAIQTQLTGLPFDKKATPVSAQIAVSNSFTDTMPAYSFTIIRLKTK